VLRIEIDKRFPTYRDLLRPAPLDIAELQKHLNAGEALVAFQVGDEQTYVWAIPHQGRPSFAAVDLDRATLDAKVQRLRLALDPGYIAELGDLPAFDLKAAHELYAQLLAPVSAGWLPETHLLVVPDGPIGQLPLGLLTTARTSPGTGNRGILFGEYRDVPWLARTHAVTVLPAVAALPQFNVRASLPASSRAFAGFGDPWFSRDQRAASTNVAMRGGKVAWRSAPKTRQADSADLALLPPLPETAEELRAVAVQLKANPDTDVFLGGDATEAKVKAMDLSDRRVIAFATHGLLPGDIDGLNQPALAMTAPALVGHGGDGLLTVDEILALELNAEWVVLSACNTGAADGRGAEAVSGLGRAFFYAGAHALLVSNWPVHSEATRDLMTTLFGIQARDSAIGRAEALRLASLEMADKGAYRDPVGRALFAYAHPIFWAPFTVVGDGRGH
jgi:CHAT domain-containing protein